jgi:PTH1 family peptidyl-tRNA hydrolase
MRLIVGLGNPGVKYAQNRHNIGFMAVDAIAEACGFGPWRTKFNAQLSEGRLGDEKVSLLKPMTYMNRSGQPVGEAVRFYKLTPADVTVIHDDLDLAPGKCRVKQCGGHAGHNGLRSIHEHIGDAYGRVRLGIGHPGDKAQVSDYVLHDFGSGDRDWLEPLIAGMASAAPRLVNGDGSEFMNAVALAVKPERPKPSRPVPAAPPAEPAVEQAADGSPFGLLSKLLGKR